MNQNRSHQDLRVGIMCYGTTFPRWQAEAIKHLVAVNGVELAVLIVDIGDEVIPELSLRAKLKKAFEEGSVSRKVVGRVNAYIDKYVLLRSVSLWRIYRKLAARIHPMPCDSRVDLKKQLEGVPVLRCRAERRGRFSQYFSARDIKTIAEHNLDIILRFGFTIIRGEILKVPRYGVWSYHHDDQLRYRGQPPGFWEIYHGDELNGAMLQRLTDKLDDGVIIHKEYFRTIRDSYSKNVDQIFMGSVRWPAIACQSLLEGLGDAVFRDSPSSKAQIYKDPTNWQIAVYFARLTKYFLHKQYQDLFGESPAGPDNWAVGIIREPLRNVLAWNVPPTIQWLVPPEGRFYADPFVIRRGDVAYIFFEDFDYATAKGCVSMVETSDFRTFSEAKVVLERPYHLSYPYVFEHGGRFYCIPEQYQSGEVALYEAEDFPRGWVKRATLIQGFAGIDPTLLRHDDQWWLFLTNRDTDDETNLYIFYSDHLSGPWKPHARNPVKTADKRVRPAGRPFLMNGALLRPAQNGSKTYGGSLLINAVTILTRDQFEERFFGELEPKPDWPYPDGLHTLSIVENITLIDAKRRLPVRNDFGGVFIGKVQGARRLLSRCLGSTQPEPVA